MKKKSRSEKRYEMAKPIYWKRSEVFPVAPPKAWTVSRILDTIGMIIGVALVASIIFALSSCSMTQNQIEMEYQIDKLYNQYSYERDSIIIEYNNKPN
jgi:hypothetical protein|tara:strand:- start:49 stop:342 length:294 start_codon:yes stop_codon:yes gene_type:complete